LEKKKTLVLTLGSPLEKDGKKKDWATRPKRAGKKKPWY
jgi:hypothetical protein